MSLISDPHYLIHSLRLSYLRSVDDPFSSRLISLNPSYSSNPYIVAASLADPERWPELAMPTSPNVSEEESDRPSPLRRRPGGGANLKHTQTIMGPSRSGAFGMRTSARRATTSSKRASATPRQTIDPAVAANPDSFSVDQATVTNVRPAAVSADVPPPTILQRRGIQGTVSLTSEPENSVMETQRTPEPVADMSTDPAVQTGQPPAIFVPRFRGAAEMEARRRMRLQTRRWIAENKAPILLSSSGEEDATSSADDEDEDPFGDGDLAHGDEPDDDGNGSIDDGDEFDPDFAATRTIAVHSASASDILFVNSVTSMSNPPALVAVGSPSRAHQQHQQHALLASTSYAGGRNTRSSQIIARHKATTAATAMAAKHQSASQVQSDRPTPTVHSTSIGPDHHSQRTTDTSTAAIASEGANKERPTEETAAINGQLVGSAPSLDASNFFARRTVAPIAASGLPAQSSLLTAMLNASASSANPLWELYGAISSREEASSIKVKVFFPHARGPSASSGAAKGHPASMNLNVRRDATVEEVIGLALWTYWEEGWLPRLDEGLSGEDDPVWAIKLSAIGWILRIAEDDGEVDDEFPPPDRTGKIAKFNFDAYAILAATPAQITQNQILESKIQRRPSRTMTATKPSTPSQAGGAAAPASTLTAPSASGASASTVTGTSLSVPLSTSLGPSSHHGPLVFLRIRVADTADAVHVSTTISVSSGTYMQEALEIVCRRRKLLNPNDYALLLGDMSVLIPLDRTVQSLEGQKDLVLIKRSMLPQLRLDLVRVVERTTDPNASIFKRISDVPVVQHSLPLDITAGYKKYTIYRKSSMLSRTERTLAIDGAYIHIMPSTSRAKAVFDSGKTSSYHIKSVVGCQQSAKSSSIFKLIVQRDNAIKRYDFEAENPKLATEIVQTVRGLRAALDRSGIVNKSRRSRQVV